MTDRPILFSASMIRALLDGRKSMTRRVLKPQPKAAPTYDGTGRWFDSYLGSGISGVLRFAPGDRLWVREAWSHSDVSKWMVAYRADGECGAWCWDGDGGPAFVRHGKVIDPDRRDGQGNFGLPRYGGRWRSPIHMPRWASRLTLTVTDVRVQRVQEIIEDDAQAEGIEWNPRLDPVGACKWRDYRRVSGGIYPPSESFAGLWDSLNAKRGHGWVANPWVAAISFDVHRCNIDKLEAA